jgi:3-phosphoglycerate kinase
VPPGEALMLENVRFHKEEEKNVASFSKDLAKGSTIYVNDAFGTAHRYYLTYLTDSNAPNNDYFIFNNCNY